MKRFLTPLLCVVFFLPSMASALSLGVVEVVVTPSASGTVPRGAQRVGMLDLALTNSCDDEVTIASLRLQHASRGDVRDVLRVYALKDGERVSRTGTLRRDGSLTLRMDDLTIDACETARLQIVADLAEDATAGGEHRLLLDEDADVDAGAKAVKVVVISQKQTPSVRTAPITEGSVSIAFLPLTKPVRFGSQRTLSRFTLTADGDDDLVALTMTLTNDGKARSADIKNLFLETTRGERVTDVLPTLSGEEGDLAVLTFLNEGLPLPRNETKQLVLKGDIGASRKRTIRFTLEEESDLIVRRVRSR